MFVCLFCVFLAWFSASLFVSEGYKSHLKNLLVYLGPGHILGYKTIFSLSASLDFTYKKIKYSAIFNK